jgi:hypothetical protein
MRALLVLAAALSFAGCAETSTCPPGTARAFLPSGGRGPCASIPSGGDAAVGDAGPCGTCGGQTPYCRVSDGECVACVDDEHCSEGMCDPESGACVACSDNAHCTDPAASSCEQGTCVACSDNAHCAHLEGVGVCDDGRCVQCSADDASACSGNACKSDGTCSEFEEGAQEACEPCDTDDNCKPNFYCVPMRYMGEDRPGGYCLEDASAGCVRPFSIPLTPRTTLSGVNDRTFCGIHEALTTCEAVRALIEDASCPGGRDDECPEGGLCRTVGALPNRCTYRCITADQCLAPVLSPSHSTCGDGGNSPPNYCGG